jgi:hypothetical protein
MTFEQAGFAAGEKVLRLNSAEWGGSNTVRPIPSHDFFRAPDFSDSPRPVNSFADLFVARFGRESVLNAQAIRNLLFLPNGDHSAGGASSAGCRHAGEWGGRGMGGKGMGRQGNGEAGEWVAREWEAGEWEAGEWRQGNGRQGNGRQGNGRQGNGGRGMEAGENC